MAPLPAPAQWPQGPPGGRAARRTRLPTQTNWRTQATDPFLARGRRARKGMPERSEPRSSGQPFERDARRGPLRTTADATEATPALASAVGLIDERICLFDIRSTVFSRFETLLSISRFFSLRRALSWTSG